jgi:HK97 family phage prohead protease
MANKTEKRSLRGIELRAGADFTLQGIAAAYNVWSGDLGGFREMIAPGAFKRALRERQEVKCLFNHNANFILGRTKNGSLVLTDTAEGLAFRCQLIRGNSTHEQLYSSVQRGDIDECSFAFAPTPGGQTWTADRARRTLTDVDLFDVSVVTNPAYPSGTKVDARSAQYVVDWRTRALNRAAEIGRLVAADRAAGEIK